MIACSHLLFASSKNGFNVGLELNNNTQVYQRLSLSIGYMSENLIFYSGKNNLRKQSAGSKFTKLPKIYRYLDGSTQLGEDFIIHSMSYLIGNVLVLGGGLSVSSFDTFRNESAYLGGHFKVGLLTRFGKCIFEFCRWFDHYHYNEFYGAEAEIKIDPILISLSIDFWLGEILWRRNMSRGI